MINKTVLNFRKEWEKQVIMDIKNNHRFLCQYKKIFNLHFPNMSINEIYYNFQYNKDKNFLSKCEILEQENPGFLKFLDKYWDLLRFSETQ